MHLDRYDLKSGEALEVFEFVSVGNKGRITKVIQYSPTNYKDLYILGFGDKNNETGELDDLVVSNNGDGDKVLATVVTSLLVLWINIKVQWFMLQEVHHQEIGCTG